MKSSTMLKMMLFLIVLVFIFANVFVSLKSPTVKVEEIINLEIK